VWVDASRSWVSRCVDLCREKCELDQLALRLGGCRLMTNSVLVSQSESVSVAFVRLACLVCPCRLSLMSISSTLRSAHPVTNRQSPHSDKRPKPVGQCPCRGCRCVTTSDEPFRRVQDPKVDKHSGCTCGIKLQHPVFPCGPPPQY
jgi:hypothetical protein